MGGGGDHYIGATRARFQRRDDFLIDDYVACERELDMLLTIVRVHVDVARTVEFGYLRATVEAFAECLICQGITQSRAMSWLYEDGVTLAMRNFRRHVSLSRLHACVFLNTRY